MSGTAEVLESIEQLREVEDDWRALAELRSNAFVTPEWYRAFLENARDAVSPAVFVARRPDGSVLGVVPFIDASKARGLQLRFAGASLGDYFHPAAAEEDEDEVARLAATALVRRAERPSLVVLHNVDSSATWPDAFRTGLARRVTLLQERDDVLPYATLGGSWETFLAGRSRNLRSQLGRKVRSLEKAHEVTYRRTTSPEELPVDVATFFYLHHRRWHTRGGSSLAPRRVRSFHHDFAAAALARGWLRLWFLEVDGVAVAAWYGWRVGDRYAYYSAGFDPDWAEQSVGLVLFAHTLQAAAEEGAETYDMLLGNESYKSRFETAQRHVRTVVLARSFHPQRAAATAEVAMRRAGGRLPESVREPARRAVGSVTRRLPTSRVI